MPGFDDGLGGISFDDAHIPLGATGDSPTPNQGATPGATPPPASGATPTPGSPPKPGDAISDDLTKTKKPGADQKVDGGEKPAPYDQDPKWKKARAAEAVMDKLMDKLGVRSHEEVVKILESSSDTRKLIGNRDIQKLLKDSEDMESIRSQKNVEAETKKRAGETPEQTIQRLERKMSQMELDGRKARETQEEIEYHQGLLEKYEDEVISTIQSTEDPLPPGAKGVLGMIMDINNPIRAVDISDIGAVRGAAKDLIGKFSKFISSVQQKAIDDYANGKSSLVASKVGNPPTPGASGNVPPTPANPNPAVPPSRNASTDSSFGDAKREFMEVLAAGLGAP